MFILRNLDKNRDIVNNKNIESLWTTGMLSTDHCSL